MKQKKVADNILLRTTQIAVPKKSRDNSAAIWAPVPKYGEIRTVNFPVNNSESRVRIDGPGRILDISIGNRYTVYNNPPTISRIIRDGISIFDAFFPAERSIYGTRVYVARTGTTYDTYKPGIGLMVGVLGPDDTFNIPPFLIFNKSFEIVINASSLLSNGGAYVVYQLEEDFREVSPGNTEQPGQQFIIDDIFE